MASHEPLEDAKALLDAHGVSYELEQGRKHLKLWAQMGGRRVLFVFNKGGAEGRHHRGQARAHVCSALRQAGVL